MARAHLPVNAPLYLQVETTLKEMIEDSVYTTGQQIPSERELSEQLGVSRMTVRKAVDNLVRHGLLERQSTNGTFVRQPKVFRRVGKDVAVGLTQLLAEEGGKAGSQLLAFEEMRAPLKVAEKLNLRVGEQVVMIRRVRTINGQAFCVETSFIPRYLVPGLTYEDLSQPSASLYTILQNRYQIALAKNSETLKMSYATADEAKLLSLKMGDPVLLLRSVVMDQNDRPIEYLKSVNHPELVMFSSTSTLAF